MGAGATLCESVPSAPGMGPEVSKVGSWGEGGCEVGEARASWDPRGGAGTRISFIHFQTCHLQDVESLQ